MKKILLFSFLFILLFSCSNGSEEGSSYTLTITVTDIPESANGNKVEFEVAKYTSDMESIGDGGADTTVISGEASSIIYLLENDYSPSSTIYTYASGTKIDAEIYIDVAGSDDDYIYDDTGDVQDAINASLQGVIINENTTITVSYDDLNIIGPS